MITDDIRVVNTIVRERLAEKRCMDCGKPLMDTTGYCKATEIHDICGMASNQTSYTDNEYRLAFKKLYLHD